MIYLILLLGVHLIFSVNLQFTAWPEMLTYPWLIQNGFRFYGDIVHPYLPALPYFLVTVYSVFGLSVTTLRMITLLTIIVTDLLVWLVAKAVHGTKKAYLTLGIFVFLQLLFEGNGLWFDMASLQFVLLTIYILLGRKQPDVKQIMGAGLVLGVAVLIKQTNILFLLPVLPYLGFNRKWLLFCLMVFLPLSILSFYYGLTNQLTDFFFWGIRYPLTILPRSPGFLLLPTVKQLFMLLFIFSPVVLLRNKNKFIVTGFFVSLTFAFPRFAYFHLQHAVAFLSLLLPFSFKNRKLTGLYLAGLLFLFFQSGYKEWGKDVRFFEPGVQRTREELTKTLPANTRIFYYNVPSQYFAGTQLLPMKPWVDAFPWYLEVPGMQERISQSLIKLNVEWVVHSEFSSDEKFALGAYRPSALDQFIHRQYVERQRINSLILLQRRNAFKE